MWEAEFIHEKSKLLWWHFTLFTGCFLLLRLLAHFIQAFCRLQGDDTKRNCTSLVPGSGVVKWEMSFTPCAFHKVHYIWNMSCKSYILFMNVLKKKVILFAQVLNVVLLCQYYLYCLYCVWNKNLHAPLIVPLCIYTTHNRKLRFNLIFNEMKQFVSEKLTVHWSHSNKGFWEWHPTVISGSSHAERTVTASHDFVTLFSLLLSSPQQVVESPVTVLQ